MPRRRTESSAQLWSGLFHEYSARVGMPYQDLLLRSETPVLIPSWTIEPTIKAKSYHKISLLFDKEKEVLDGIR